MADAKTGMRPDAIPNLPLGPFSYETTGRGDEPPGTGHLYIVDANGRKIASVWGRPAEKMALAELIIAASERAQ